MKTILEIPTIITKPIAGVPIPEVKDYEKLENIPSINEVPLKGNLTTKDLNIDIPTKVSDLENDSEFITLEEVPETDLTNYYDKAQTDKLLDGKQPVGDYALKNEISIKKLIKTDEDIRLYELEDGVYLVDGETMTARVTSSASGSFNVRNGSIIIKVFQGYLALGATGTAPTFRIGKTGQSSGSIYGYDVLSASGNPKFKQFVLMEDVLLKNNSNAYTPSGAFNPATKKYVDDSDATVLAAVDDKIETAIGSALEASY